MMEFDPANHPHRRRNLLTGEWVLVSPHRAQRPWQGDAGTPDACGPAHDPGCYLCPGNVRANGVANPDYAATYVFANDFPALLPDTPPPATIGPFESSSARGTARVICFAPDHSQTLADLDPAAMRAVIDCWCDQSAELGATHAHVQLFENKGAMMGCSSPHPHGQVWASDFVPTQVATEDARQRDWNTANGSVLLDAVVAAELADGSRIVEVEPQWLAVVPHWASWPFETLVIARDPVARIDQLGDDARVSLAALLSRLLRRYDGLFGTSFPYSMGWHGAPHGQGADSAHWRLHAHFYPPLLRSATVRKFMVGYEMMAEAQRDLTPEAAAQKLREVRL
jgi:UDPglucose--hexose-1-phosphate uridylyltransferase